MRDAKRVKREHQNLIDLPNDVLSYIFGFLFEKRVPFSKKSEKERKKDFISIRRVCNQWRKTANSSMIFFTDRLLIQNLESKEATKFFLEMKGINPKRSLNVAAEEGYLSSFELLMKDPRVNPSANRNEALISASIRGRTRIVQCLLEDPRIDPSYPHQKAIYESCFHGHVETCRLLLKDPRVDPSTKSDLAIRWAACRGNVEVVKLLLEDPRVNPASGGNMALRWAQQNGQLEVAQLLLKDDRVFAVYLDQNTIVID